MKHGDWVTHQWYTLWCWETKEPEYRLVPVRLPYRFRYDPVPYVRNYSGYGRYIKKPQSTQERRKYFDAVDQGVHVRGKRRAHLLPNAWDDDRIAAYEDRSWKRTKKRKQWM
jgi:hypothetical protein